MYSCLFFGGMQCVPWVFTDAVGLWCPCLLKVNETDRQLGFLCNEALLAPFDTMNPLPFEYGTLSSGCNLELSSFSLPQKQEALSQLLYSDFQNYKSLFTFRTSVLVRRRAVRMETGDILRKKSKCSRKRGWDSWPVMCHGQNKNTNRKITTEY